MSESVRESLEPTPGLPSSPPSPGSTSFPAIAIGTSSNNNTFSPPLPPLLSLDSLNEEWNYLSRPRIRPKPIRNPRAGHSSSKWNIQTAVYHYYYQDQEMQSELEIQRETIKS